MNATLTATFWISISNLAEHPEHLDVLGDGRQRKSYLYVQDCVDAMLLAVERGAAKAESVQPGYRRILHGKRFHRLDLRGGWDALRSCNYAGGKRGWIGDSPFIFLEFPHSRLGMASAADASAMQCCAQWIICEGITWIVERR